jgi:hypothetical protein
MRSMRSSSSKSISFMIRSRIAHASARENLSRTCVGWGASFDSVGED